MPSNSLPLKLLPLCVCMLALTSPKALAVDGVVLIDQNRALAGNVTPGDTPGFPVTISQPGSYRLSGNLVGTTNARALHITVSNVTLDLNGFQVECTFDASVGFNTGCIDSTGTNATAVRNGKIAVTVTAAPALAWAGVFGAATILEHVQAQVTGTGPVGALAAGPFSIIRHNTARTNSTSFAVSCPTLLEGNANQQGGYSEGGTGSCTKVNNIGFFGF